MRHVSDRTLEAITLACLVISYSCLLVLIIRWAQS